MSNLKYEFFMSQIKHISDIKENEKIKISLVFHEGIQSPCILKMCKNRDLSGLYQALIGIKNPNIAVIYDFVYANNNTYVLEECISGRTLGELLVEKKRFTESETAKIILEVCNGLEDLHGYNPPIIHNDINTSNIMIREDGSIKLFDYDISRFYREGASKNTRLLGTEEYASPEHYGFGQSEPRTDIYSLGVTMHEMLTGQGLSHEHKMFYKGKLEKVLAKCIEVDPQKRYSSVQHLKKDLEKYVGKKGHMLPIIITSISLIVFLFAGGYGAARFGQWVSKNTSGKEALTGKIEAETQMGASENEKESQSVKTESEKESQLVATEGEKESQSVTPEDGKENLSVEAESQLAAVGNESESQQSQLSQEDTSQTNSETVSMQKKMEVVYNVEGALKSMIATNDGLFVMLECIEEAYYIRTSEGGVIALEGLEATHGAKLVYDTYTDSIYVFGYNLTNTKIYKIVDDWKIQNLTEFSRVSGYGESNLICGFFSDGMMICNEFAFQLMDSKSWTIVGEAPYEAYIINDKMYKAKSDIFDRQALFTEVDFNNNVIHEYDELDFEAEVSYEQIYTNGRYAYFIGEKGTEQYVYRFDGESFEEIAALNEYKYYSEFEYNYLCVTEQAIRCYDTRNKVVKEFQLN